jgi:tetratricopeptide (TPR) repeat protein
LRSVVILQEQLRATRMEVEQARLDVDTSSRHAVAQMTERLNFIEQKQVETLQSSNRLTLIVVGGIAFVACLSVMIGGFMQMRAVAKLTEISRQLELIPALAAASHPRQISAGEFAHEGFDEHSAKLAENVTRLEAKIEELEQSAGAGNGKHSNGHNGGDKRSASASMLIAKGQTLLSLNKPGEALTCFEEATTADERNTEAWIKKGSALERLQRIDDAIAAYDRAIRLDEQMATAYLFKAGVYNRQKRYAEALQCYEKALSVQKSRAEV